MILSQIAKLPNLNPCQNFTLHCVVRCTFSYSPELFSLAVFTSSSSQSFHAYSKIPPETLSCNRYTQLLHNSQEHNRVIDMVHVHNIIVKCSNQSSDSQLANLCSLAQRSNNKLGREDELTTNMTGLERCMGSLIALYQSCYNRLVDSILKTRTADISKCMLILAYE